MIEMLSKTIRIQQQKRLLSFVACFQRWSNAERLVAIDRLIDTCEPTQVRHMMQVIEPQFQRDFISLLPREVRYLINKCMLISYICVQKRVKFLG
jgi:hypothetical protein